MKNLKEINGKYYQECQVHLVKTIEKEKSLKGYSDGSLLFSFKDNYITLESEGDLTTHYHLYITSNEEITINDWCLMFDEFGNIIMGDIPRENDTFKLKIDSHNCITIKPIKDSYTREEVENL